MNYIKIPLTSEQEELLQKWLHDESFCKEHLKLEGARIIRKAIYNNYYSKDYQWLLNLFRENWIEFKYSNERNY